MDKTVAGVLGAVSALAVTQAHAVPAPSMARAMQANSYADLLGPIPNALDLLAAEPAVTPGQVPAAQPVQWGYHHHHHHHHNWWGYRHHHHHGWYGYNPYGYYGGYGGYYGYGYNPYAYGYNPYTGY